MGIYTWNEYYVKFCNWSFNTQKYNSNALVSFGPSKEVCEIIREFAFHDKKFANSFAKKALKAGVHFAPNEILQMTMLLDESVISKMAESASRAFSQAELEQIYMYINDTSFEKVRQKQQRNSFGEDDRYRRRKYENVSRRPPKQKLGFFDTLLAIFIGWEISSLFDGHKSSNCDRDHDRRDW